MKQPPSSGLLKSRRNDPPPSLAMGSGIRKETFEGKLAPLINQKEYKMVVNVRDEVRWNGNNGLENGGGER